MAEAGFGISSHEQLLDSLRTMPAEYQAIMRTGFADLGALDEKTQRIVLEKVRTVAPFPSSVELDPIVAELGLERGAARGVVAAARLLTGLVSSRDEDPEEIVSVAVQ